MFADALFVKSLTLMLFSCSQGVTFSRPTG